MPNRGGSRPGAAQAAGRERAAHRRLPLAAGRRALHRRHENVTNLWKRFTRAGLTGCLTASVLLLAAASFAEGDEHEFVGVVKCGSCHKKVPIGNQIAWWHEDKHSKAFETLASDKAKEWAAEAGVADPQTDDKCIKCHATAHGVPDDQVSRKFDRQAGVQCESCHGAGKDYRKKKIMVDQDLAVSKGLVLQSEKVCVTCHNDESPAWDTQRYTRADGSKVGFDYDQAVAKIRHPVPEGYDPLAQGEAD